MNVDDGLEEIKLIRGLGGEKIARGVLRSSPKPETWSIFRQEGSRFFGTCFLYSSAQTCLYQTPAWRPPRITGRFVNTVTRG